MARYLGLLVAVMVFGFTSSLTLAADAAAAAKSSTKTGVVTKVDAAAKTVTVMVKRDLTFTVTNDTKIVQGDAAKTFADIKEGATVTIDYTRGEGDLRTATKIDIGAAAAPEKK